MDVMSKITVLFCLAALTAAVGMTGALAAGNAPAGREGTGPLMEKADKDSGHHDLTNDPPGETRTYRDSGLIITVKKLPDELGGHKTFEVTVENQNAVKKSLSGRICLFDLRIKQAECGSGECPVYMEVRPKSKDTKKFNCREKSFFSAWTFVMEQVYDY